MTVENKGPRLLRGPSLLRGPTNVENIDRLREAQFDMFAKEGNAQTRGPKTTVKSIDPKRKAELHQPAKEGNAQTGEVPVVEEGKAQTRGPKTRDDKRVKRKVPWKGSIRNSMIYKGTPKSDDTQDFSYFL